MSESPLTVSELNRQVRAAIERQLPLLWVTGEVSNLMRATSGHVYFSLKDASAQVRCVMFRNRAQLMPFRLENGQKIEVRALASLYEARGDFQLTVETARQAGLGSLYEAFVRMRERLAAAGLFDAASKRAPPLYPRRIGIITSPAAAALRDVLATLQRRAPHVDLVIYPAAVQGEDAPARLVAALQAAAARKESDVLLLVRGGGGLEDLQAFNDEQVARAVRASPIPLISGIGHETDTSIADLAADVRAATPTAAAELVSAGWFAARAQLDLLAADMARAIHAQLDRHAQTLDLFAHRLTHPAERLARVRQRLAHLATRLTGGLQGQVHRRRERVARLNLRLTRQLPQVVTTRAARLERLAAQLAALNPEAILARGYSVVRDAAGHVVSNAATLSQGDALRVRFAQGQSDVVVTRPFPD